jgi:hypothetical protein
LSRNGSAARPVRDLDGLDAFKTDRAAGRLLDAADAGASAGRITLGCAAQKVDVSVGLAIALSTRSVASAQASLEHVRGIAVLPVDSGEHHRVVARMKLRRSALRKASRSGLKGMPMAVYLLHSLRL